jgi:hypothetical protein
MAVLVAIPSARPAAVLARMLGIHITVAVVRQRANSGDGTTCAADISRHAIEESQRD